MPTYAERLRDPRWQRKRLEIFNRDGFKCVDCGSESKNLQVHHAYYLKSKAPWDYPDESLSTLCEDCHKEKHEAINLLLGSISSCPAVEIDVLTLEICEFLKTGLGLDSIARFASMTRKEYEASITEDFDRAHQDSGWNDRQKSPLK